MEAIVKKHLMRRKKNDELVRHQSHLSRLGYQAYTVLGGKTNSTTEEQDDRYRIGRFHC